MKLIASMMVGPGEEDRYLTPALEHLLSFCDEIRIRSETTAPEWPSEAKVMLAQPSFYVHEGRARQELLDWTMEGRPTHILVIDADEFVADGAALRREMEADSRSGIWKLEMTEVWGADEDSLNVRMDGKWPPRPVGIAFQVPGDPRQSLRMRRHFRIQDSALACGRVPIMIQFASNRTPVPTVTKILHFGWACKADRPERYRRYEVHDNGKHHDIRHLRSIMYEDSQVQIHRIPWPASLDKQTLLARVNRS